MAEPWTAGKARECNCPIGLGGGKCRCPVRSRDELIEQLRRSGVAEAVAHQKRMEALARMSPGQIAAALREAEARAEKITLKASALLAETQFGERPGAQQESDEFQAGYERACRDIATALRAAAEDKP